MNDDGKVVFERPTDLFLERSLLLFLIGTSDEAHALLELPGFMLGINGVATFKKSSLPEALREVPLTRLVIETDSPYLAPTPFRGKRNESAYVERVLEKLIEIYQLPTEQIANQIYGNSLKLFF